MHPHPSRAPTMGPALNPRRRARSLRPRPLPICKWRVGTVQQLRAPREDQSPLQTRSHPPHCTPPAPEAAAVHVGTRRGAQAAARRRTAARSSNVVPLFGMPRRRNRHSRAQPGCTLDPAAPTVASSNPHPHLRLIAPSEESSVFIRWPNSRPGATRASRPGTSSGPSSGMARGWTRCTATATRRSPLSSVQTACAARHAAGALPGAHGARTGDGAPQGDRGPGHPRALRAGGVGDGRRDDGVHVGIGGVAAPGQGRG